MLVKGAIATVPFVGWFVSGLWMAYDAYDIYDSADDFVNEYCE